MESLGATILALPVLRRCNKVIRSLLFSVEKKGHLSQRFQPKPQVCLLEASLVSWIQLSTVGAYGQGNGRSDWLGLHHMSLCPSLGPKGQDQWGSGGSLRGKSGCSYQKGKWALGCHLTEIHQHWKETCDKKWGLLLLVVLWAPFASPVGPVYGKEKQRPR